MEVMRVFPLRKTGVFCVLLAVGMFVSCTQKTPVYMPFDDIHTAPRQSLVGSSNMVTEEGRMQIEMQYPAMLNYTGEESTAPAQVFPQGIKSVFYNQDGTGIDVLLFADSAINFQNDKLMKFYRDVRVYDMRTLDTLYTEALYWNQDTHKIYSDVFVRKVSPGLVLEGEGFDSDERMENVVLRKPRGVIR